jgi:hypothetical protein
MKQMPDKHIDEQSESIGGLLGQRRMWFIFCLYCVILTMIIWSFIDFWIPFFKI